jgi:hypothetical protein
MSKLSRSTTVVLFLWAVAAGMAVVYVTVLVDQLA